MITYKKATTDTELRQILHLQKDNIAESISSEEKEKEGFVTVIHDFELLQAMNAVYPHHIAKENNTVVGYALCMHPKFGDEIAVLRPMFAEIHKAIDAQTSWMVMGQICIDKAFRKKGIFRRLYEELLTSIQPEFSTLLTEVDATNTRSLNAHFAIGFKELTTYEAGGKTWCIISLSTQH